MEQFNNIPATGLWNSIASILNTNFTQAYAQFVALLNATSRYKGVYQTLVKLQAAVVSPVEGDWAYVGTSFPMPIYNYTSGSWVQNGTGSGGESVSAVNAAKIAAIADIVTQAQQYLPIEEDGWYFTDTDGNTVVSITDEGINATKLTDGFIALIKAIDGIGLSLGETIDTAYPGISGKNNNDAIIALQKATKVLQGFCEIAEDGFYIVDENGNIGMGINTDGISLIKADSGAQFELEIVSDKNYNI